MSQLIATSKATVVVGLGATGLSVARYFQRQGRPFMVADSRANPPMLDAFRRACPDVKVQVGPFAEDQFLGVEEIILSPGVSRSEPAIAKAINAGVQVIGDIDLFSQAVAAPFIAITGSNGKTTVTTLVAAMAEHAGINVRAGGNLGTPALDLLDDDVELYVLEVSSFQLESTRDLGATVATVLNMSADHMDRYGSLPLYHQAKQRVYYGAKAVVANRDDMLTMPPIVDTVPRITFGLNEPDLKDYGFRMVEGEACLVRGLRNLLPASAMKLLGKHNIANALAALALGEAAGIDEKAMLDCLQNFEGLPHRCQKVAVKQGRTFVNDSKATNVGSTLAALEGLASNDGSRIVLIAGGDGKGADFSPLRSAMRKLGGLVVIGRDGDKIAAMADSSVQVARASGLEEAVKTAAKIAREGDTVLLSPACASFDMFANYEDRGRQFSAAVEALV